MSDTKKNILSLLAVFIIFVFAIFLRVYFSFDEFYSESLKYSADDGIYHMRLIENELLGGHFPNRINFDPYTNFPNGTYEYFAPLYDQILAVIIWVVSLGHPTLSIINNIAPFYPVVLGGLTVFLAYFIAKLLWGRLIGILSALIMAAIPPFLYKSLIGSVDHHVAEIFFSSLTMLFLILSLKSRKNLEYKEKESFLFLFKKELKEEKKFWVFCLLTSISLGLYFLTWGGALLFFAIIFAFISSYYLIRHILGENHYWILLEGIIIFLIPLIMILPFSGRPDFFNAYIYNFQHFIIIISGIFVFLFLALLSFVIDRKKIKRYFIFLFILISLLIFFIGSKYIFPDLFSAFEKSLKAINTGVVNHSLARELIGEMAPFKLANAFNIFFAFFYFFLIGLAIFIFRFLKGEAKKPEHFLLIIWSLFILLIIGIIPFFGQQRFVVYLSFNVSLFASFLIIKGFIFSWKGLEILKLYPSNSVFRPFVLAGSLMILFNILFFIFFPFPTNITNDFPENMPQIIRGIWESAKDGLITKEDDAYEAMVWLKENTPDPGVDYYELYKEPGINKETGKINAYSYPDSAYGVLAIWDIGHMITYYAHRMAVSNPFQQGIGRKDGDKILDLGEAVFFLETDEEKAISYLDKLKVKYVITDYFSAIPNGGFEQKIKWAENTDDFSQYQDENSDSPNKFDNSMIARLHILDGRYEKTGRKVGDKEIEFYIKPLDHFRLIFESKNTSFAFDVNNGDEIKKIKIFEYVKGAKISGKAKLGDKVSISAEITTNQGRKFTYEKSVQSENGEFEFIVPYSTFGDKGWIENGTKFSVFAGLYKLKIGDNKEVAVEVSEKEVLEGETINIK